MGGNVCRLISFIIHKLKLVLSGCLSEAGLDGKCVW